MDETRECKAGDGLMVTHGLRLAKLGTPPEGCLEGILYPQDFFVLPFFYSSTHWHFGASHLFSFRA